MSVDASQVCAVIVTRGDVDLNPVLDSLDVLADTFVWNNSREPNLGVYGRYAMLERHGTFAYPVILVQDDDVILPPETIQGLFDAYEPGKVVCNVPGQFRHRYHDSGLVGFGAIFDRDLPDIAFTRFGLSSHRNGCIAWGAEGVDISFFNRTCDIVFTMLTPLVMVDLPYTDLDYASNSNRMWKQPGHFEEREQMRELCRKIRDGVTA